MSTNVPSSWAWASLVALSLTLSPPLASAQTARKSDYDEGYDIRRELDRPQPTYSGKVSAIEPQDAATTHVVIRSVKSWPEYGFGDDSKARDFVREFILVWKRGVSPIPFVAGMGLEFTADDKGNVTSADIHGTPVYYRRRPDGLVELLVHYHDRDFRPQGYIRIVPDRLSLMAEASVYWSRRHGVVVTMLGADGGEAEQESANARRRGLPVANRPGETVFPGRDGWTRDWPEDSRTVVPPQQYIGRAG